MLPNLSQKGQYTGNGNGTTDTNTTVSGGGTNGTTATNSTTTTNSTSSAGGGVNACTAVSSAQAGAVINPAMSGRINTRGKKTIKYGKVQVRAKLPQGDWLWPAIWMLPQGNDSTAAEGTGVYGAWPASGEIDVCPMSTASHPSDSHPRRRSWRRAETCPHTLHKDPTMCARP